MITTLALSSCNEGSQKQSSAGTGRSYSVMATLRARPDPKLVAQIAEEEAAAKKAEAEAALKAAQAAQQPASNESWKVAGNLPAVNAGGLAPAGSSGKDVNSQQAGQGFSFNFGQMFGQPSGGNQGNASAQPYGVVPPAPPPPPMTASYGSYNTGMPSAGFVPPPPAVSLGTAAQVVPPPYGMSAYGGYPQDPYAAQPAKPSRPSGVFGSASSGAAANDSESVESSAKKKKPNIAIIRPTGMDARSPFKQRDDLRVLWKGALATPAIQQYVHKDEAIAKVDVALPGEASKGSLSISGRQIDALFKNGAVDRKILPEVKRAQTELVQGYYRYLYAFNKFSLAQQTVAARKQEVEIAETASEKQRAELDLARSQEEADASKEDLKVAQADLAALSGANAARTVIASVSGIAPSMESLAQAESQSFADTNQDKGGGILSVFGLGKGSKNKEAPVVEKVAKSEPDKSKDKKEKPAKKDAGTVSSEDGTKSAKTASPKTPASEIASVPAAAASPASPISMELRSVSTMPRKSILTVAIKNRGDSSFSFDPESVAVTEGQTKLTEAAVRAEFGTTIVQPNAEVTGTITIYGRPWNDRLSVSLADGSKTISLKR